SVRELLLRVAGRDVRPAAVAAALEQAGYPAEALQLAVDNDTKSRIATILHGQGAAFIDSGMTDLVEAAIERLEGSDYGQMPMVLALRAREQAHNGRYDTAEAWYRQAVNAARDHEDRTRIAHWFALDLVRRGRADAIDVLEPFVAEAAATEEEVAARATLATAYAGEGLLTEARATIESALASLRSVRISGRAHARINHQAAYVYLNAGEFERAERHARAAVALAETAGAYDVAARALTVLYQIAYDVDDDIAASAEYLEQCENYSLKSGNARVRAHAVFSALDIAVQRGDDAQIERLDRALGRIDAVLEADSAADTLLPAEALRHGWQREFASAFALLDGTAERLPAGDRQVLRWAEIAVYAAAAREGDAARIALMHVRDDLTDASSKRGVLTRALAALAALMLDKRGLADEFLDLAPREAAPRRLSGLLAAVKALAAYPEADRGQRDALRGQLEALRANSLGGYARLIAALPIALVAAPAG
ncbi:MAG: hypothetical protein JO101_01470, partial [Candidatus Eremiobacteraeota bacterium]|nr:hypothetical protein [Candidatus Eremiobacteraeota bacterium]